MRAAILRAPHLLVAAILSVAAAQSVLALVESRAADPVRKKSSPPAAARATEKTDKSSADWVGPRDDTTKDEFRTARRDLQARLRNREVVERIAAVRELQRYPTADAIKLLVNVGMKDQTPEVRSAAYNTLWELRDNEEVAKYLLATVSKESRRGAFQEQTLGMLAVLLSSSLPDIEGDVTKFLAKQADTENGLLLVETLADELGQHGESEDVAAIKKLIALPTFRQEFGLRRAVVQALTKCQGTDAVGPLIEILEKAQGEIRPDIIGYLTSATGEDFGLDAAAWRAWWKENEKTFNGPASVEIKDVRQLTAVAPGRASYYGLSIYAQRLVFIIDTSGSMLGPRLLAAKRELLKAIDGLTDDTHFSVLAFNSGVYAWQKQLVPATTAMKHAASNWVTMLEPGHTTASFDALEAGLRFDAEAIFFLTDGEPHGGKVTDPAEIVSVITRENYTKRRSIYTIGIGVEQPGGIFNEFLSTLAKQNWGIYRRVDQ